MKPVDMTAPRPVGIGEGRGDKATADARIIRTTAEIVDYYRRHGIRLRHNTALEADGRDHPVEGEDGRVHSVMVAPHPTLGMRIIICPEGGVPIMDDVYFELERRTAAVHCIVLWMPDLSRRRREVGSRWKARRRSFRRPTLQ